MNLDTTLWISGISAEVLVLGLLLYHGIWKQFPFFSAYNLSSLIGTASAVVLLHWYPASSSLYISYYLIYLLVDSVLLFAVLVELAWSVLRPLRGSLPPRTLIIIVLLILAVAAIIWPFASLPKLALMARELAFLVRLKQTVATLAVLAFLVLAAGSQFLAIGWRSRELQIATGLGLYSLVGMVVTVLHTYPRMSLQYNRLDQLQVASFLCSLIYWIFSFAQQEQERREMSPQAQDLLLAMAGAARTTRISFANSREQSTKRNGSN